MKILNREQRERHEQEKTDHTHFRWFCATTGGRMGERGNVPVAQDLGQIPFGRTFSEWRRGFLGTLPFLFAVFACFAVKNSLTYNRHSLLEHPNYKELQGTLPFCWRLRKNFMNRKQRERHERGPLLPSRLSVPTLEGRGNLLLGLFLEPL